MAFNKLKKIVGVEAEEQDFDAEYAEEADFNGDTSNKMILIEPRAYSESQQIADHLKRKSTVVVNLKRVTPDQAKRIADFLSGTVYALGGGIQKLGGGIFLCTPRNVNIEGSISEDASKSSKKVEDDDFNF